MRDDHSALRDLGAAVFGLSTQDTAYQREAVERLGLTYPLLSDESLALARRHWGCPPSKPTDSRCCGGSR